MPGEHDLAALQGRQLVGLPGLACAVLGIGRNVSKVLQHGSLTSRASKPAPAWPPLSQDQVLSGPAPAWLPMRSHPRASPCSSGGVPGAAAGSVLC